MYPELALAIPFVFLCKMNFKTRLIFLGATLATAGVLVGFHIGRVSIQQEDQWRNHYLQSRNAPSSRVHNGRLDGDKGTRHSQGGINARLAEWRSNMTSQEAHRVEELKTRIVKEADEILLRRGVKVKDEKQEDDFPPPISLKPREKQPGLVKQDANVAQHVPAGPANQRPLPPVHPPANPQAALYPPPKHKEPMKQGQANIHPPMNGDGPIVKEKPIARPPADQKSIEAPNLKSLEAAKAAAGRKQSIHYAYEPIDILPEPEPLERVEVEPVSDAFGQELLPFKECIHLSVVVCGDRTEETLVMLKSAAILTKDCLVFHILAEDDLQGGIRDLLNAWPEFFRSRIHVYIYPITFPAEENKQEWKKVFKLCATQRLFLPDLLPVVDSLLYVDTDILFIKPLDKIWNFFSKFNSTQMAALSPEHEVPNIGWYNRFARHPYYGKTGLNSGVMLMNLTRMREFRWINRIIPFYRQYRYKITWGDQDLINILFYFHPDKVYEYPCEWNYRPDHCMYGNNCHRIETEGIAVIHGNRGVYHNEKQLPFRSIYETYRDFHFGGSVSSDLIQPLKERWMNSDLMSMYCTQALRKPILSTLARYT